MPPFSSQNMELLFCIKMEPPFLQGARSHMNIKMFLPIHGRTCLLNASSTLVVLSSAEHHISSQYSKSIKQKILDHMTSTYFIKCDSILFEKWRILFLGKRWRLMILLIFSRILWSYNLKGRRFLCVQSSKACFAVTSIWIPSYTWVLITGI